MVWRQSSHIFNQPQHRRYWTRHSCSITLMQKQQFNRIPRRPPLVTLMEQRVVHMEGHFWSYRWGLRTHTQYTSFTNLMWQKEDSLQQQRNKAIASNNQTVHKGGRTGNTTPAQRHLDAKAMVSIRTRETLLTKGMRQRHVCMSNYICMYVWHCTCDLRVCNKFKP